MKRPRAVTAAVAAASAAALALILVSTLVLASTPNSASTNSASTGPASTGSASTGRGHSASSRGATASLADAAAPAAAAVDHPTGFWYGTDSLPVTISGKAPYAEPKIGGSYGGYIGMAGNWAKMEGCSGANVVWSATDSKDANTNYTTYKKGIGTGVYWFMGGPGVDPKYNGTTAEATAWGAKQAAATLTAMSKLAVKYPVVFMDIELPGIKPALDNGWNAVYTSTCSGKIKTDFVAASIDRADLNGYRAYILAHSAYTPGVYSSPSIWGLIFGTGSAASIPTLDEWTYTSGTSKLSPAPSGWCLTGTKTCAHFFGGVTTAAAEALMWQWSGGGGVTNGVADFDQIDANRRR